LNMILRDWQVSKKREDGYPKIPFVVVPIHLWGYKAQTDYINRRIHEHLTFPMKECTPEEKWQRPTTFAVMEKGRKKAMIASVYNNGVREPITSKQQALEVIKQRKLYNRYKSGTIYIQERPGRRVRCEDWCLVRSVCPFNRQGD